MLQLFILQNVPPGCLMFLSINMGVAINSFHYSGSVGANSFRTLFAKVQEQLTQQQLWDQFRSNEMHLTQQQLERPASIGSRI